ncbi:MAG: PHP domain-containing protein [Candidatus Tectomicrobia bacterium]|uniref:PHP domain-containing protein n=1 Tax=Tectimicrobiota bacterium TaxID=2528274 RepID=A0A932CMK8_UNCTE|nr:PHP domain-containing protein [Candidatus Tectomicrobia bacterium]
MIIDMHVHTKMGSSDSLIEAEELVGWAAQKGLDGVCITEHDCRYAQEVAGLGRGNGVLWISGIEVRTNLGDILAFGLDGYRSEWADAEELKRVAERAGALLVAAHPFRRDFSPVGYGGSLFFKPSITLGEACRRPIFQLVDGLEVMNGSSTEDEVEFCLRISEKLGLLGVAGSDAHSPKSLGGCVTIFEQPLKDENDFLEALRKGRFRVEDRRSQIFGTR